MSWSTGTGMHCRPVALSKLCLLAALVQTQFGCARTVDIDASDSVAFANLESSISLNNDDATRLRVRAASASGDFGQTLDDDERIRFDDGRIDGPAELDGDVDIQYYSLALGWDRKFQDNAAGTLLTSYYFGVQRSEFDLTLEGGGTRIEDSDAANGVYFQFGMDYVASQAVDLGFDLAVSLEGDRSYASEMEFGLEYAFYRHMRVSGGYRWFDFHFESDGDDSDLEVDYRGFFLGLNLAF